MNGSIIDNNRPVASRLYFPDKLMSASRPCLGWVKIR